MPIIARYDDDDEFIEALAALRKKVTRGKDVYWSVRPHPDKAGLFQIVQVNTFGREKVIGRLNSEDAADYVAALFGAYPSLIERFEEALDLADELDSEKDDLTRQLMYLEDRVDELESDVAYYRDRQEEELVSGE